MKRLNLKIILMMIAALLAMSLNAIAGQRQAQIASERKDAKKHRLADADFSSERTIATDAKPTVFLCAAAGDVIVNGWERNEVRVRAKDEATIDFRANSTANRVDVLILNGESRRGGRGFNTNECSASTDLEIDAPRGATVQIKTRAGNVDVRDVAMARIETMSGDVSIERVSNGCEASSLSGDVRLRNSRGRARLRSVSGSIEAVNVQTVEPSDDLSAKTVSGDVRLEKIAHARVEATTTSGEVRLKGALTRGGHYELKSTSGDVTVMLASETSCQVNARVFQSGDIISDFPLKLTNPAGKLTRQLVGIIGADTADAATLNISSFSGTVHLRKNQ
jgi:DUF4097 and DUF4098 domain-containing protein YvlB